MAARETSYRCVHEVTQMRGLFTILGAALIVTGCAEGSVPSAPAPATSTLTTPPAAIVSPAVDPGGSSAAPATVAPASAATPTATAGEDAEEAGDSWVEAGVLNEGRSVTQLAVLDEAGEVLAVGADVACGLDSEASDTTELYDMDTGTRAAGNDTADRAELHPPIVGQLAGGV